MTALGLSRLLVPPSAKASPGPSSAKLLLQHGFVHQNMSGIYTLLPLGLRVVAKIESIIKKHLNNRGAVELALPTLVEPALWQKSGRLEGASANEFLFTEHLKYLLAPTGEEQITELVGTRSYRQLPLKLYQITRKYRKELRPRGGLLRTREFVMKDLYTFDSDRESAQSSYQEIQEAYMSIFNEIGVPFVVAEAESGAMGGNVSHEFQYLSPSGDDQLVHCSRCHYTANIEKAVSGGFVSDSVVSLNIQVGDKTVAVEHPAGRVVSEALVAQALRADRSLERLQDIRCNENGVPLVQVQEGDSCLHCGSELKIDAGIEVGHTFLLGERYSGPLGANVVGSDGESSAIQMGCYGIGVTRLVGAIAAALQDQHGLVWPHSVAPAQVIVVSNDINVAASVAGWLVAGGLDAVYEDRTTQLGHAMRAAREAGWPAVVIAGRKYFDNGILDWDLRSSGRKGTSDLAGLAPALTAEFEAASRD